MACTFGQGFLIFAVGTGLGVGGTLLAQAAQRKGLRPRLTFSPLTQEKDGPSRSRTRGRHRGRSRTALLG